MKLIRDLRQLPFKGCVATLGNFDGLHVGHQQLLQRLKQLSRQHHLPTVVMTFEPHPKDFFSKNKKIPRLMRFKEKWRALRDQGIDYVVCLRFNAALAGLSAESFIEKMLVSQLQVKAIIVGDDVRFGAKRAGDFALLKQYGDQYGFSVEALPTVLMQAERVSSTKVREALQKGDLTLAAQLLGRPYALTGKVMRGDQRGRELGYPTANVYLSHQVPLVGIFAVRVQAKDRSYLGVASLGWRPMFPTQKPLLEVYLFDFMGDLYGASLTVEFLHKLRDEKDFDSTEALIEQIEIDVAQAKKYLKT